MHLALQSDFHFVTPLANFQTGLQIHDTNAMENIYKYLFYVVYEKR
jgi:hypothetical protein